MVISLISFLALLFNFMSVSSGAVYSLMMQTINVSPLMMALMALLPIIILLSLFEYLTGALTGKGKS